MITRGRMLADIKAVLIQDEMADAPADHHEQFTLTMTWPTVTMMPVTACGWERGPRLGGLDFAAVERRVVRSCAPRP